MCFKRQPGFATMALMGDTMLPEVQHEGLDALTRSIVDWLDGVHAGTDGIVVAPDEAAPAEGLALRLIDAEPVPVLHNDVRSPMVLRVRYLVTAASGDVFRAQRMYGELLFAAAGRAGLTLAHAEDGRAAAERLGLAPALHLLVEARFTRPRRHTPAPPVRHPPTVIGRPMAAAPASQRKWAAASGRKTP
jgi:hypothetical protein